MGRQTKRQQQLIALGHKAANVKKARYKNKENISANSAENSGRVSSNRLAPNVLSQGDSEGEASWGKSGLP